MTDEDRLTYLRNSDIRAEIAYAVGGDPSRYKHDRRLKLKKSDLVRIATAVSEHEAPASLTVRELYELLDGAVPGMDHTHNSGRSWGITRDDLKTIHQAVGGRPRAETVTDGGEIDPPEISTGDRVTAVLQHDGEAEYVEGVVATVHSSRTIDVLYRVESRAQHGGDGAFERDDYTDTYEFQTSLVYMADVGGWIKGWDDA
jgi:hypothetical protein